MMHSAGLTKNRLLRSLHAEMGRDGMTTDARYVQIAALSTLLVLEIWAFDLGATPLQALVTVGTALVVQAASCRATGTPFDWRSPLVTGLSLSLLLRSADPLSWVAAAAVGIGSKFLLRIGGKHVFNPACFAIVAMLATGQVWVSPGLWGNATWLALMVAGFGGLVLARSSRLDIALAFLASYGALLLGRCLWLGDPLTIPAHQMQSGALLIFSLFMITDPRSTPDSRSGRMVFAFAVAAIGYHLQFRWQVREGLFYALAAVSLATPLIDRWRPSARFAWSGTREA
ncbi:RnfABCDGE type electron transport complex subunit D [Pararoseomonas sp. SCSIO 73927]|uniref:RnfABCDGE type electron transport complex subunit D n=1 Tax=Pararoseomonas sp. SCSIO 73927 TaxID=3114537 RepID=UPI0030D14118